jgi:hypothetical protein
MEAKYLILHGYNETARGAWTPQKNLGFYALGSKNFGLASEKRGSEARHSASGRPSSVRTMFVPSTIATIL